MGNTYPSFEGECGVQGETCHLHAVIFAIEPNTTLINRNRVVVLSYSSRVMSTTHANAVIRNPIQHLLVKGEAEYQLRVAITRIVVAILHEASWAVWCTDLSISVHEEVFLTLLTFPYSVVLAECAGWLTGRAAILVLDIKEAWVTRTGPIHLRRIVNAFATITPARAVTACVVKTRTAILSPNATLRAIRVTFLAELPV